MCFNLWPLLNHHVGSEPWYPGYSFSPHATKYSGKIPREISLLTTKSPFYAENIWGKFPLRKTVKRSRSSLSDTFEVSFLWHLYPSKKEELRHRATYSARILRHKHKRETYRWLKVSPSKPHKCCETVLSAGWQHKMHDSECLHWGRITSHDRNVS